MKKYISLLLASLALFISVVALTVNKLDTNKTVEPEAEPLVVAATKPAGLFTYRLSGSGISSSATSFTLSSLTLPQNDYPVQDSDLSDTFYITIEPGSQDRQEFLSCTTVGANTGGTVTISGCTRGLSPITPYTASTTLQFVHPGGSAVIFSDSPGLLNQFAAKEETNNFTGIFTVSTTTDGDLSSPQTRIYFGGGSSTTTSAYIWLNRSAGTMGFRTASQAELAFSTGGTTFTVVNPITSVSSEIKLATSTYDFVLRDSTLLGLATSTIASGTASGRRMDDYWNYRWNATTTHPGNFTVENKATSTVSFWVGSGGVSATNQTGGDLFVQDQLHVGGNATTSGYFVIGTQQPTRNLSAGDLWIGGRATTTSSISVGELCIAGANCVTTIPGVVSGSTTRTDAAGSGTVTISGLGFTPTLVEVWGVEGAATGGSWGRSDGTNNVSINGAAASGAFNMSTTLAIDTNQGNTDTADWTATIGNFQAGSFDIVYTNEGAPATITVYYKAYK